MTLLLKATRWLLFYTCIYLFWLRPKSRSTAWWAHQYIYVHWVRIFPQWTTSVVYSVSVAAYKIINLATFSIFIFHFLFYCRFPYFLDIKNLVISMYKIGNRDLERNCTIHRPFCKNFIFSSYLQLYLSSYFSHYWVHQELFHLLML